MTQSVDLGAIDNVLDGLFRGRVNEGLRAVATMNSGASEPPLTYPNMRWCDTDANRIYLRNNANTTWTIDGTIFPFSWASASFVINVKQLGAVGDGAADDTAAISAAIAAMPAGGGRLYFPAGIYSVNSTLALNKSGVYCGDGNASVIRIAHASANIFNITASSVVIEDLSFSSSVTRTGGSFILVSASDIRIQRFSMNGAVYGISIASGPLSVVTVADGVISDCKATTGVGVLVQDGYDISIRNIIVSNASQIAACILVQACGDLTIEDCVFIRGNYGLLSNPVAGQATASLWVNNTLFLVSGTDGALILGNGGSVVRCIFNQCEFTGSAGLGLRISTASGGAVSGIDVNYCRAFANGGGGLQLSDSGVHDTRIIGGAYAGNTGAGIGVVDGVNDFIIMGIRSGVTHGYAGNGYGVYVLGTSHTNYTIGFCDLRGNSTAGLSDSGTGTKQVMGNL